MHKDKAGNIIGVGEDTAVSIIYDVFSDDTVRVYLNTMILDKELKRVKSEYRYTNYIGIGLIFLLIWQLWIISS